MTDDRPTITATVDTKDPDAFTLIDRRSGQRWRITPEGRWERDERPLDGVTPRHTHVASAEKDEDGMWEIDCADPYCTVLAAMRVIASRYTAEADAVLASAAIITMIGEHR